MRDLCLSGLAAQKRPRGAGVREWRVGACQGAAHPYQYQPHANLASPSPSIPHQLTPFTTNSPQLTFGTTDQFTAYAGSPAYFENDPPASFSDGTAAVAGPSTWALHPSDQQVPNGFTSISANDVDMSAEMDGLGDDADADGAGPDFGDDADHELDAALAVGKIRKA
ncbi:hypothetical protein GLOTRDRAFT_128032 [Gloeophyllum trabeum ATCC 11539]|uniref:Uncharacterized protein n=1 Tax=Gloeophyllum trabeum (strain ATCC 11539 / FP-39264 / Madison 617) TaxID=670483 RepID=S7RNL0_GLOTA|nr:uncharacterized protein GLOTRDRAFT_128032 [Gloeophyllum trabeum ATCC 11539]EPQ56075.1 hypothetical protein GLOTRDRAFT_128032 [Gloeophyllum trabeum ATCC 11539]